MKLELPTRLTMQEATAVLGGLQSAIGRAGNEPVELSAEALRELDTAGDWIAYALLPDATTI